MAVCVTMEIRFKTTHGKMYFRNSTTVYASTPLSVVGDCLIKPSILRYQDSETSLDCNGVCVLPLSHLKLCSAAKESEVLGNKIYQILQFGINRFAGHIVFLLQH